ncbi:SLC13 family permease [Neomoorella humiferrea]|uniref:Sodium-dependent dicarboxylate transporter SdcS n=1 Tax=Neomoorella humiferrea TaxID=676965 RepID=A0A2T0AUQ5_9FIRM|nr:DASS family sodium-coupled anion symporter [Moorella humiferrea]PRR74219.1 Sodium-dependent dicarboxylate transporter SdcS [Moorella humiferrea]
MNNKRIIGLIIGIAIFVLTFLLPPPAGMSVAGKNAFGILISGIVLWVLDVFPIAITAFILMILLPFYGVTPKLADVFKDFISPTIFFLIATFALTTIIMKTPLANRLTAVLFRMARGDSRKIVLGFILATALLSSIMSNVPTTALCAAVAITALQKSIPDMYKSNLVKAAMIGIPFGAVVGGIMTPAGSPNNIMALYLLEDATNIKITFLQWMIIGIPVSLLTVLVCWLWVVTVIKPEPITKETLAAFNESLGNLGPMSTEEKKVVAIILTMLVLWIASTWFPVFDTTLVALCGLIVMFLPGVELLTWKEFNRDASWDMILMIGGIQAVTSGILKSGGATWVVNTVLAGAQQWNPFVVLLVASTIMAFLHVLVPAGPPVVGMALPPMAALALNIGVNPVVMAMIVTVWANVTFLLPIDMVPLITYSKGYYTMTEMVKAGWLPTLFLIVFTALAVPFLVSLAGL